jgi:hypothetical protein
VSLPLPSPPPPPPPLSANSSVLVLDVDRLIRSSVQPPESVCVEAVEQPICCCPADHLLSPSLLLSLSFSLSLLPADRSVHSTPNPDHSATRSISYTFTPGSSRPSVNSQQAPLDRVETLPPIVEPSTIRSLNLFTLSLSLSLSAALFIQRFLVCSRDRGSSPLESP